MKYETGNNNNDSSSVTNNVKICKLSNAFQIALKLDSMEELEKMINDSNINAMDQNGLTMLHKSILAGRADFVRTLINLGANVRLSTRDGWSALHLALWVPGYLGSNEIYNLLITS